MTQPSRHRIRNSTPWLSEAELATSWSRRLPTISNLYEWGGKKHYISLKLECQSGVDPRSPTFQASSVNHCTRAPVLRPRDTRLWHIILAHLQCVVLIVRVCYLHSSVMEACYAVNHINRHIYRPLGYVRVYLPLCKVADTPFHIQGDDSLPRKGQQQ